VCYKEPIEAEEIAKYSLILENPSYDEDTHPATIKM
jgi:hypothetical protein